MSTVLQPLSVSATGLPRLDDSVRRVLAWVRRHDYKGYEPADGNLSFLHVLTMRRVFPMRVLQQLVLRSPINVRPILGVRPHESAIARGYLAWGCLLLPDDERATNRTEAVACLDWLLRNGASTYSEFCWGDPYEYATRSGRRPHGEPILIWTALIGQAFLTAFEKLQDSRYLAVAASIGRWILSLPREQTSTGACLSYVAYRQSSIHNANLMGAAFLARLAVLTGNAEAIMTAREAVLYSCARQRPDGSWLYAEEPKYSWVDSFHTGYNLSAIKVYRDATGDDSFDQHVSAGLAFYVRHFFEEDGCPKYMHDRKYPVDIQCAAQAIETLALFSDEQRDLLPLARRVADWTITNMQAEDGHFCFRDLGWTRVTTPMLHWGQGTMVKALAVLLHASSRAHV